MGIMIHPDDGFEETLESVSSSKWDLFILQTSYPQ